MHCVRSQQAINTQIKMILLRLLMIISLTNATYLYFEQNSYEIYLSESAQVYTKIGLIKAISSPALAVQYELHGDTNKTFYLNSQTGELILLKPVDYETISEYKLTVEGRSSSVVAPCFNELVIHIINVNDNPPEINLIVYPSALYELNTIKYDLSLPSTPFATINIKDLDQSSNQTTLSLNDTDHFQVQLIRQFKNDITYILSTNNNTQFIHHDNFYLLLTACDHDQPSLCTNQSYRFRMKSTEYLCNLSFQQKNYIIDIKENLPEKTLLMRKVTNEFCGKVNFSIDDIEMFSVDWRTGDLFSMKRFNRIEQSIHMIRLFVNDQFKVKIFVRILDRPGNLPFLINKHSIINRHHFSSVHIFNSTFCRPQPIIETYFQLLSNCTITALVQPPPQGRYLFDVALSQQPNFQDTFSLELADDDAQHISTFSQLQWITLIPIILGLLVAMGIAVLATMIIKQKQYKLNQLCPDTKRASSFSSSSGSTNDNDKSRYNKYDSFASASKLKVHDDYELPPSSSTTIPIYVIQKSSPPLLSLSPVRDDEGYSGSSDVSEHHLPFESNIISGNGLLEQYHIHEFVNQRPILSVYDVPRQHTDRLNIPRSLPDVTLV